MEMKVQRFYTDVGETKIFLGIMYDEEQILLMGDRKIASKLVLDFPSEQGRKLLLVGYLGISPGAS
jgi:hypothetical protein